MITPLNNDTERDFLVRPLTSLAQNVVLFKGWFDQPIPRLNSGFDKGEAKLVS
tara:strand:+ start:10472 stop:10630 length:159 start_codon:yes stop_codon:yes gene_type:complete